VPVLAAPLVEGTNHIKCRWLRPFRHWRYTQLAASGQDVSGVVAAHANYVR
jgi:hypothetical protein